jgi:hypothetical protein
MSLPANIFLKAIGIEDYSDLNRSDIIKIISKLFNKELIVMERREFSNRINRERILRKTNKFWKKFNVIDEISSLIYVLQNNGEIVLGSRVLKIKNGLFYINNVGYEENARLISPKEAISFIVNYLSRKFEIEKEIKEFLIEKYTN